MFAIRASPYRAAPSMDLPANAGNMSKSSTSQHGQRGSNGLGFQGGATVRGLGAGTSAHSLRFQLPPQRPRLSPAASSTSPGSTPWPSAARKIISSTSCSHPRTGLGAPMLSAHFPRAYVDVNREPYELDPRMFEGRCRPLPISASVRVAGGLGTVPRIVAENMEIYRGRLPVDGGARPRSSMIYKPYHAALRRLIARTHAPVRPRRADRLPFHARQYPRLRQRHPAGFHHRRSLWHLGFGRICRALALQASARISVSPRCATSPMPAASSPNITAGRRAACMRCRSRSTAASISTRQTLRKKPDFDKIALARAIASRISPEATGRIRHDVTGGRIGAMPTRIAGSGRRFPKRTAPKRGQV